MRIKAIHIRRFRSILATSIPSCGGLNVFIGKNNAGKSSILQSIDLTFAHLRRGRLSAPWDTRRRPADEFCARDTGADIQIAIEFGLDGATNASLRTQLHAEIPQFERGINELSAHDTLSVVVAGALSSARPFVCVRAIGLGRIDATGPQLSLIGDRLLELSPEVARELFTFDQQAAGLRRSAALLEQFTQEQSEFVFSDRKDANRLRYVARRMEDSDELSKLLPILTTLLRDSDTPAAFAAGCERLAVDFRERAEVASATETTTPILAYAGETHVAPAYAAWLMNLCGSTKLLHFRENKLPIGPEEAASLLALKVRRGGEERLSIVKQTVRSLLGVSVDAFEPEDATGDPRNPSQTRQARRAEMDIDDFIVDANGSGIREALRMILDVELGAPDLVLIEEPEKHLHPGLEHAIHGYLREKSVDTQVFLTTHSTNFVDTAALQNVYLITRGTSRRTTCEALSLDATAERVLPELGLRLSAVFMYDTLVFVEGKSDEDIIRELARNSGIDLASGNVGFVQMGGVGNFAHFAADATLDLLAKRRVKLRFVVDRDEKTDSDVDILLGRLGPRARLHVLRKRELDNYLIVPAVIVRLLEEKANLTGAAIVTPSPPEISTALAEIVDSVKDEVLRLRLERVVLSPVYLRGRSRAGSVNERIEASLEELRGRLNQVDELRKKLGDELDREWPARALDIAPGSLVLDSLLSKYGFRYSKTVDGPRIARLMTPDEMPDELLIFIREITALASAS